MTNHCQQQSGQDTLYTPTPEPTNETRNAEANLENLVLKYAEDNILVTRVRLLIALFDSFTCFWYQVFMKDPYYMKMTRDRQMSRLAFFGSAGGWLGLCCGLSIISVCKTVYHDITIMIIIITRPKPPYGRQGLAGSWARIQSGGYILGRSQRLTSRLRRSARIG